ncbi:MAG: hypothetical protein U0269_24135 [Polyangiales bacterium]
MVFRTPSGRGPELVSLKTEAPSVVGFGIDADAYVLLTARDGGVERWVFAAHGTESKCVRQSIDGPWDARARCLVSERSWLLVQRPGVGIGTAEPGTHVAPFAREGVDGEAFPLWIDGAIRVLHARNTGGHAAQVALTDASGQRALLGPFSAGNTARTPLAACATVHGPIAVFSTDRDDELDVCAIRDRAVHHRTVSLGSGQTFVAAAGGGSRVAIVSRKGNDVRVRTIASDLRSELNSMPLAHGTRAEVGEVRVVHGGGATFVIAHEEHGAQREVVLTVFEDGKARTLRTRFAALHGLALAGKHIALAALVPGALSPLLYVQQLALARDDARGESFASAPKRRAYVLGEPPTNTPQARKAALVDAAEVLAQSLSAQPPREVTLEDHDAKERVAFIVPGSDPSRDMAVSIELHEDGSAIINVKMGDAKAPAPRPLSLLERLRVVVTGDDDGDPSTSHFELGSLFHGLGDVVMAVWALKLTRA